MAYDLTATESDAIETVDGMLSYILLLSRELTLGGRAR